MRPDEQLIEAILNGEQASYAELVHRYEASVCAAAVRILHNVYDGQDAAQETFIKAYQKLPMLRKPERFGPWVMRIARRTALDMVKKKARSPAIQPLDSFEVAGNNGKLSEASEMLLATVMKLPEQEKRVILLHHFDRHSVREVAKLTGRAIGTVTKQLSRAYGHLRETLPETKL